MPTKKKKKGRRRRSGEKRRSSGPKAKPAGLAGGAAIGGFDMVMSRPPSGISSPLDQLLAPNRPMTESLEWTLEALKQNMTNTSNYKYPLIGLLITASPKIPLVGIVARPADRGLKRLTKGKWGL